MRIPPPHIDAKERDALYSVTVSRLSAIPDILLMAEAEEWEAADKLLEELIALMRLLEDLGWGDKGSGVVLRSPPDLLRRALSLLQKHAEIEDRGEAEERKELAEHQRRNQLVQKVCARHLADLEGCAAGR